LISGFLLVLPLANPHVCVGDTMQGIGSLDR